MVRLPSTRLLPCALLATALTSAFAQKIDIKNDFVLLDNDAVGMLAPRVVSPAVADTLSWSPDGTLLLVKRFDSGFIDAQTEAHFGLRPANEVPPPKAEIVIYSFKADKVRSKLTFPAEGTQFEQIEWLPGASSVALEYTQTKQGDDGELHRLALASLMSADGRVRTLASADDSQVIDMQVSKTRPIVSVVQGSFAFAPRGSGELPKFNGSLTLYGSSGNSISSVKLPENYAQVGWGSDGELYVSTRKWDAAHKSLQMSWRKLNPSNGQLGNAPGKEIRFGGEVAPKKPLPLNAFPFEFKVPAPKEIQETAPTVKAIALASSTHPQEAFVFATSDGTIGKLSPAGNAVAYIHHGVALVRPIIHVPKDAYLELLAQEKRMEILSRAKQVGLAFIMFASDNDDKLPDAGQNWMDTVNPYLRNRDMMNGFVFSLTGADLTKVDKPAETELGYIPGPGGRAVVYADGHVKWEKGGS